MRRLSTDLPLGDPDPVLVRAREPVPRAVQPAPDPAARRLGAHRAGAAGGVAPGLVPVPARTGSSCCSCSCSPPASSASSSTRSSTELFDFVFRSVTMKARPPRPVASCGALSAGRRRAPTTSRGSESVLAPDGLRAVAAPAEPRPAPRDRCRPRRRRRSSRGTAYAGDPRWTRRRAAPRHRQARRPPRRVRPRRRHAVGRGRGARHGRRVVGDAAGSPAGSGCTCATPSSARDRIRLAGGPEEAARWAAAHHDRRDLGGLGIPDAGRRRARRRRQRLTAGSARRSELLVGDFTYRSMQVLEREDQQPAGTAAPTRRCRRTRSGSRAANATTGADDASRP